MTDEDNYRGVSIYRCAIKKGNRLARDIFIDLCLVVDLLTALAITVFLMMKASDAGSCIRGIIYSIISKPIENIIVAITSAIYGVVAVVPWWGWIILAVPVVIYGYAVVWCVMIRIKDEDYVSKDISRHIDVVLLVLTLLFTVFAIIWGCIWIISEHGIEIVLLGVVPLFTLLPLIWFINPDLKTIQELTTPCKLLRLPFVLLYKLTRSD